VTRARRSPLPRILVGAVAALALVVGSVAPGVAASPAAVAATVDDGAGIGIPLIEGLAVVGQHLQVRHGRPYAADFTYQWYADGLPIAGQTDQQMWLTAAQAGKRVSVEVTVAPAGAPTAIVNSLATPRVSTVGKASVGRDVLWRNYTVSTTSWPAGTSLSYQWIFNGFAVSGATRTTFFAPDDTLAGTIAVLVTATRPGYETVTVQAEVFRPLMVLPWRLYSGVPSELPANQAVGGIAGELRDDHGSSPVVGARVRLYSAGSGLDNAPLRLVTTLTSDSSGRVAASDLAPGLYCMWIDPPSGSGLAVEVDDCRLGQWAVQVFAGSTTDVTQMLYAGSTIKGTITSSIGSRVAGAVVTIYRPTTSPPGQQYMLEVARTTTNANGQYTIPGQWFGGFVHVAGPTSLSHRALWWSDLYAEAQSARSASQVSAPLGGTATANAKLQAYLGMGVPAVSGVAHVGNMLSAVFPATSGAVYSYQWFANGVAVAGATKRTLVVPASLEGRSIQVQVTGVRSSYLTTIRTSASTTKVIRSAAPSLTGSASVGRSLSVSPGSWTSGTTFTYQWYRNTTAIPGATGATYHVTAEDRGTRILVRVQGHKAGYTTVTRPSSATTLIAQIAYPTVVGTPVVGGILTAAPGVWTPGTAFGYQWYANGAAIAGARSATLRLTAAQRGTTITVRVTGAKAGYTTYTLSSAATPRVG
jgi:hypothetical protein